MTREKIKSKMNRKEKLEKALRDYRWAAKYWAKVNIVNARPLWDACDRIERELLDLENKCQ